MPYLNNKDLTQHAIREGYTKEPKSSPITQKSKAPVRQAAPRRVRMGSIRLPSKRALQQCAELERVDVTPKYTEYRQGLMKTVTNGLANVSHDDPDKKATFIEGLRTSKDLHRLIIDTALIKKLDELSGAPKIALTVFGCYGNSL